jgi:hypothetical protein
MIKLNAQAVTVDAAAGDEPSRTITGIAVPYGETAIVSDGQAVRFEQGALPVDGKAPKLFMYHDSSQPVGLVTARQDTDQGMLFSARISLPQQVTRHLPSPWTAFWIRSVLA